jgi:hypothetical protein
LVVSCDDFGMTESTEAPAIRICEGCGRSYLVGSRDQGGPFHFKVMTLKLLSDGRVELLGHWRSGNWVPGQALRQRTRDGRVVEVVPVEMLPARTPGAEIRGQRSLLFHRCDSVESGACLAAEETETGP